MTAAHPFRQWLQLEQLRLGTRVTFANDEFFAAKERIISTEAPVFVPDKYDDHGKWMDGWETRRRREPGHDYCVIRLGVPGVIHGVDIDTSFFTGNYPPQASLEACVSDHDVPSGGWQEILPLTDLQGDAHHLLTIASDEVWSHLRLNIFPDGGIARLRVYGELRANAADGLIDLFALENGGRAIDCSDQHYGSMHNLNVSGRGVNMGDGWETARRRGPGHDWAILKLGQRGTIESVEVDTAHFKGNYPDRISLEGASFAANEPVTHDDPRWQVLLPDAKLYADSQHAFEELQALGAVSHVRMCIYPDGGISRVRLFGHAEKES